MGPMALSEHANNHPADGEDLSARLLQVLGDPKNAKVLDLALFVCRVTIPFSFLGRMQVFAKSVFILNCMFV